MARALKVYSMPAGFYDAVVAAPSQAAALNAWGTTTDLFAAGRASVVTDKVIRAEALARPGEVIQRSRGDEAAMLGPEPKRTGKAKPISKVPKPPPAPSPPDRSDLDTAERRVSAAESEKATELARFTAERDDLDRREAEALGRGDARIREAADDRDRARAAYDRAVAEARG